MELISISLARIAVFLELQSLDPNGSQTTPESAHVLAQRYGFARVPKTVEEMDFQKGVIFAAGRYQDIAIDQFQIFNNGVIIDTRSSTDDNTARSRSSLSSWPFAASSDGLLATAIPTGDSAESGG